MIKITMTKIKRYYAIYITLLIVSVSIVVLNPVSFQKVNSIKEKPIENELQLSDEIFNVAEFLSAIPYSSGKMVYAIVPEVKFRLTIENGIGNCSNLVFGTAYYLNEKNINYEIIHLLPQKSFLKGEGHTVLRAKYQYAGTVHVGIIDVIAGGLPMRAGKFLDAIDLQNNSTAHAEASIVSLNERKGSNSPYYGEFLNSVIIGYIPAKEVKQYFYFIQKIYLPLGNDKLEYYIYNGLAMLCGYYPNIYVEHSSELFHGYELEQKLFILILWFLRFAFLGLPFIVFYECRRYVKFVR